MTLEACRVDTHNLTTETKAVLDTEKKLMNWKTLEMFIENAIR